MNNISNDFHLYCTQYINIIKVMRALKDLLITLLLMFSRIMDSLDISETGFNKIMPLDIFVSISNLNSF